MRLRKHALEACSVLNDLFQNGVVTAGSASGICDGAAAVIIARYSYTKSIVELNVFRGFL
jgi:acetyl-CoA acetyltransferase